MASAVVAQLLFLQFQNSKEPIHMYINSPGGIVTQGLGIYDTMQYITPPVATWCLGQACSMGAFLLAAGAPGMRKALPNSTIMVHQPSGGAGVSERLHSQILLVEKEDIIQFKIIHHQEVLE